MTSKLQVAPDIKKDSHMLVQVLNEHNQMSCKFALLKRSMCIQGTLVGFFFGFVLFFLLYIYEVDSFLQLFFSTPTELHEPSCKY